MTTKALKKQLAAAIAMVLVAGVALSSSTYAWFVSNNTVTATVATISAQSNAPFLMIDSAAISEDSTTAVTFTESATKLYPAQVIGSNGAPLFQSAYAVASDDELELDNSRYDVGDPAAAVTGEFAVKETFVIGTADEKAGSFKNLKVSKVEVTAGTEKLAGAVSVLLVCDDNYAIYKASADGAVLEMYGDNNTAAGSNCDGILADEIGAGDYVTVDAYLFYDGGDGEIYTDQLPTLGEGGLTITFTATPVNTQGVEVEASNAVVTTP